MEPRGWICPVCTAVMAPFNLSCVNCRGDIGLKPGYTNPYLHQNAPKKDPKDIINIPI